VRAEGLLVWRGRGRGHGHGHGTAWHGMARHGMAWHGMALAGQGRAGQTARHGRHRSVPGSRTRGGSDEEERRSRIRVARGRTAGDGFLAEGSTVRGR
jgi:hypothetical protein